MYEIGRMMTGAEHQTAYGVERRRWTAVTESLPDVGLYVLVADLKNDGPNCMEVGVRDSPDNFPIFTTSDGEYNVIATHWMPLPAAPGG